MLMFFLLMQMPSWRRNNSWKFCVRFIKYIWILYAYQINKESAPIVRCLVIIKIIALEGLMISKRKYARKLKYLRQYQHRNVLINNRSKQKAKIY